MKSLVGRVAVVTGASRGIGVHIAEALGREGCSLILVARNRLELERQARRIASSTKVAARFEVADLAVADGAERLADVLAKKHPPIDILVNNAALFTEGYFADLDLKTMDQNLMVNVRSLIALTRLILPSMLHRNRGHIVNLASLAGLGGMAHGEVYCATKHAVVGFTRALRATLSTRKSEVSASVICPGFISETGMYARVSERTGEVAPVVMGTSTPDAVARAVVKAIRKNRTEIVVNPTPVWPMLSLQLAFPRLAEWIVNLFGVNRLYERALEIDAQRAPYVG